MPNGVPLPTRLSLFVLSFHPRGSLTNFSIDAFRVALNSSEGARVDEGGRSSGKSDPAMLPYVERRLRPAPPTRPHSCPKFAFHVFIIQSSNYHKSFTRSESAYALREAAESMFDHLFKRPIVNR